MMQSIFTKYMPATNTRPSRIKAWASGWAGYKQLSIVVSYDDILNSQDNHMRAAQALATKLKWAGTWYEGGNDRGRGNVYVLAVEGDSFTVEKPTEPVHAIVERLMEKLP